MVWICPTKYELGIIDLKAGFLYKLLVQLRLDVFNEETNLTRRELNDAGRTCDSPVSTAWPHDEMRFHFGCGFQGLDEPSSVDRSQGDRVSESQRL